MATTFWHKQTSDQPLFPELEWSRPETKAAAGKLLIVGGNRYGFGAPAEAFQVAEQAAVGTVRMVLPESMRQFVGKAFTAGELAPVTPSGSFSQKGLGLLLQEAEWADGVLLAGDFGRNSETAILLEKFLTKYTGLVTLTKDAIDYFTRAPSLLLSRENTTLVLSFAQLQKLASNAHFTTAFTFEMDLVRLVDALHTLTAEYQFNIVTKHLHTIFVAVDGQVSSTKLESDLEIWRLPTAAQAAVWWLQNPSKPFEALTTAVTGYNF